MTDVSGEQYTLAAGDYVASVASIGASLRVLEYCGRDLVVPFRADEQRPVYRGATLAPWPNRVVDGRYVWRGQAYQLEITEPGRGHALHGLVTDTDFEVIDQGETFVHLSTLIDGAPGYPFQVRVDVRYDLSKEGLTELVSGTNEGTEPAPWGCGPHPYLTTGSGRLDEWTLELPAARVMTVTPDRLIPTGLDDVAHQAGGALDFLLPKRLGEVFIDHAYTDLTWDDAGFTRTELRDDTGAGVGMEWDGACPWVQVHTADNPSVPQWHRAGLAVEPMTCPPDAFNSGTDLITLEPGASAGASWRIYALA